MEDYQKVFPDIRHKGKTDLQKAQLIMMRILKIVDHLCKEYDIEYFLISGTLLGAVRHKGFIPWDNDLDIGMPRKDFERFLIVAKKYLPNDLFLQTRENDPGLGYYGCPCRVVDLFSVNERRKQRKEFLYKGLCIDVFPMDRFSNTFPGKYVDHLLQWIFKKSSNFYCSLGNLYFYDKTGKGLKGKIRYFLMKFKDPFYLERWLKAYCNFLKKRINKNKKIEKNYLIGYGLDLPWIRKFSVEELYPLQMIKFENEFFPVPNNYDAILTESYGDYMVLPPENKRYDVASMKFIIDTRISIPA